MIVKLFNYDSKNKLREWAIEVSSGQYRTIHGVVGGKLQTTEWTQVQETNVGRSNHRDLTAQAIFEAQALVVKQKERGWRETVSELNSSPEEFDCMLAQKWEDRKDEISFPVFVQPKLDGIRLNVTKDKLLSRNKKEFKSIPHLAWLMELCKTYNCILDGELYNHSFKHDFNKITSIVKKTKPTPQDISESEKLIQYWIYDVFFLDEPGLEFSFRMEKITRLMEKEVSDTIRFVPTHRCNSIASIDEHYEFFLSEGYEGQMVRTDSAYEQKRSKTLLKRKEFLDSEYEVIDVCEGNGNRQGTAGYMVLRNTNGTTFHSNIKGSREWLAEVLNNKSTIIGKKATCQYFNLTPDGVPRFPYVISIRDYE